MVGCRRRAEDRGHVTDSRLVRGHHVGVSLDEAQVPSATRRVPRPIQPVDDAPLLEDLGLLRVHVLGSVDAGQQPSTESHGPAVLVADRNHQPTAEEVVGPSVVPATDEPRTLQGFLGLPGLARGLEQRIARRREADSEGLQGRRLQAALVQVSPRALALPAAQLRTVQALRAFEDVVQGAQTRAVVAGASALGQLDARTLCQLAQRLPEAGAVEPLQETEHVTALRAGAEAVPGPAGRVHHERRRLLLVERTARLPQGARPLQPGHARLDHLLDGVAFFHALDELAEGEVLHGGVRWKGARGMRWTRRRGCFRAGSPRGQNVAGDDPCTGRARECRGLREGLRSFGLRGVRTGGDGMRARGRSPLLARWVFARDPRRFPALLPVTPNGAGSREERSCKGAERDVRAGPIRPGSSLCQEGPWTRGSRSGSRSIGTGACPRDGSFDVFRAEPPRRGSGRTRKPRFTVHTDERRKREPRLGFPTGQAPGPRPVRSPGPRTRQSVANVP